MLKTLWHALPFTASPAPVVNQIPLAGVIAAGARTGRTLNIASVEQAFLQAFTKGSPRAVVVSINSPGGSPVQSSMILSRLRELSDEHKVPVITHIEDIGASGGYMIALAGDEIYADPFAIVGSIGVISGGFGFPEALEKLGIERRVYTAGENKSQLDPFRPENPRDVRRLEDLLEQSHQGFIGIVKKHRGDRLKAADDVLFRGDFWLAEAAAEHGLIDAAEDFRSMLRRRFGDRVKVRRIEADRRGFLAKMLSSSFAPLFSADALMEAAERKALWGKFGL